MARPSSEPSKRALARIQRLCCLGIGSEMLMPDLIREMMALVPSRGGMFRWAGPNLEITNVYSTVPPSVVEFFLKHLYLKPCENAVCRPFRKLMTLPVQTSVLQFWQHTMTVNRRTFERSDYYNLLWRPSECNECLMLRVSERHRKHGAMYIWRAPGEAAFEARDLELLESIAGFIAHAMTRGGLKDQDFADSPDRALLVADGDGVVRHAGAQAQHLLMMVLNPRWSPGTSWRHASEPIPELAWLCASLAATANGLVGQPPPVLRLRTLWGEFVLRAYCLGPTDGAERTRQTGITIERRVPRALALQQLVEALPLTGREKQLCLLLAQDPSRQDLSAIMGVAAGTVLTHQRSIYAKLGVHSRAGLLAALRPM